MRTGLDLEWPSLMTMIPLSGNLVQRLIVQRETLAILLLQKGSG